MKSVPCPFGEKKKKTEFIRVFHKIMLTPGADAMISLVADQTRREHVKLMEKTKKGSGTTDCPRS